MIRFTEEHHEIREMVADFSSNELATRAARVDSGPEFPLESLALLGELGLLGAPVPEVHGGSDGDMILVALVLEELARGCAGTALAVSTHLTQAVLAVLEHGTEAQKETYLSALAGGTTLGTLALAEHGAESDVGSITCTASRDGDAWVLDGVKKYVVGGAEAGLYVVVARTAGGRGTENLALFLVAGGAQAQGVRIVGVEDSLGLRGAGFAEVAFEACRLEADSLIGDKEQNFPAISRVLENGRVGVAAIANGVTRAAMDFARGYAAQRRAFGGTIDRFEAIRNMFADAAIRLEASTLLTYRAAARRDAGESFGTEASMAKLFASECAYLATKDAVQILGGNGFSREYPVERMYRDAKTLEVVEAPGELHRHLISRALIGEPE